LLFECDGAGNAQLAKRLQLVPVTLSAVDGVRLALSRRNECILSAAFDVKKEIPDEN